MYLEVTAAYQEYESLLDFGAISKVVLTCKRGLAWVGLSLNLNASAWLRVLVIRASVVNDFPRPIWSAKIPPSAHRRKSGLAEVHVTH